MRRLPTAVVGFVLVLTACTATPSGTPLGIETAGFQLGSGACGGVGIPPFRIERDGDSLRYTEVGTGPIRIIWPFGFSARLQDGRAVLYASDGAVVGREGDVLDEIGACPRSDGAFLAESVGTRTYR